MKRTPLNRGKGLSRGKKAIRAVSKKRAEQIPERKDLRLEQLRRQPLCQARLTDCKRQASDVHEIINRSQRSTAWLEPEFFISLCRPCHSFVTTHPLWSRRHGLTLSSYQSDPESLAMAARLRQLCNDQSCTKEHRAIED